LQMPRFCSTVNINIQSSSSMNFRLNGLANDIAVYYPGSYHVAEDR
jgi:hypothetical protein